MKKLISISLMIIISTTIFAQKGKWNKAQKINTIESYKEFLVKYPESDFKSDAIFMLMELEYNKAKESNSIESYSSFLDTYKDNNNQYFDNARSDLINLEFQQANELGTVPAYKKFIQKYPGCKYISQARASVDSLDFVAVSEGNTWEEYKLYINKYGHNGRYYSTAIEKAENQLYSEILLAPGISLCEEYLEYFPAGKNQDGIRTTLIDLNFEESSALHDDKKYKEVVSNLDKIIKLDSTNVRALRWRSSIKNYWKNYEEAIKDYEAVIGYTNNDTLFADAYYDNASTLIDLDKKDQALSKINELVSKKPGFSYSYYYRANIKYKLEDNQGALTDLAKCIQVDKSFLYAYSFRGILRSELGDDNGAVQDFKMVYELKPDFRLKWEYLKKYKSSIFTKREIYVGTVVDEDQLFSASLTGASSTGFDFWLEEYDNIGFSVDYETAIKWGLMSIDKGNPLLLKFSGKGWKVRFTTSNYNEWQNSSDKGDYSIKEVLFFKKL